MADFSHHFCNLYTRVVQEGEVWEGKSSNRMKYEVACA